MGQAFYYLYTVYQEPEHTILIEDATTKMCSEFFGLKADDWYYMRYKIERGKVPNMSLTKVKSTGMNPENRPPKGMGLKRRKIVTWWRGPDGKAFCTGCDGRHQAMCGECAYWVRQDHRWKDGKLYGECTVQGKETEKCTWCEVKGDQNERTA